MTTEREQLLNKIKGLPWFQASEPGVKHSITNLGAEAIGLLRHLANRPIEGGGVRIVSLENFYYPGGKLFGVLVNFRVEKIEDPAI